MHFPCSLLRVVVSQYPLSLVIIVWLLLKVSEEQGDYTENFYL